MPLELLVRLEQLAQLVLLEQLEHQGLLDRLEPPEQPDLPELAQPVHLDLQVQLGQPDQLGQLALPELVPPDLLDQPELLLPLQLVLLQPVHLEVTLPQPSLEQRLTYS